MSIVMNRGLKENKKFKFEKMQTFFANSDDINNKIIIIKTKKRTIDATKCLHNEWTVVVLAVGRILSYFVSKIRW